MTANPTAVPRVALISIGVGRVQRGFERFFTGLFDSLQRHVDVTLCKSGGAETVNEKIPPMLWPATHLVRRLPLGRLGGTAEYHRDCIAYGLMLLPALLAHRYDIVHSIDPPLARVLHRLRQIFRFRVRLVFTDGCVAPPGYYVYADHVHVPGLPHYQSALQAGISADAATAIPLGLHTAQFSAPRDRAALRQKYGVSENTFVILAVSAIKRDHKRVDYIIEEASRVPGDVLLWLDGNPEERAVEELARTRLGSRVKITHLSTEELPDLYYLSDVLVHAALEESFGLALVEAALSGLPVVAHDAPHFDWLLGGREDLVDMSRPGALATRLQAMALARPASGERRSRQSEALRKRYDWEFIGPQYAAMYRKVMGQEAPARLAHAATGGMRA